MRKQAVLYLVRLTAQKLLGLLLYLLGTGFILYLTGGIYFAVLLICTVACGITILRANPETLARRVETNTNSPQWDKALLGLFWLLNYFIIYLIAGLETDASHGPDIPFCLGLALTLLSGWITLMATLENPFLESTARLQTDRAQTVCSTGPYAHVRHPAYAGVLINCAGLGLVFSTPWVWVCAAAIAAIIVVRTALEDRLLQTGLPGYRDYAETVRYRLIPFVW